IGLIGYPLRHSLSPDFQQAAFDYHRLDIHYETWETPPKMLQAAMARLKQSDVIGANITLPYKEKALNFVDAVDDSIREIGAVNTIINRKGKLQAYNTDVEGFLHSLDIEAKFDPRGKRATILGAGGAARAVCFALLRRDTSLLVIVNRTIERAETLVKLGLNYVARVGKTAEIVFLPCHSSQLREAIQNSHLIVNCTTMGMRHSPGENQSPLVANWIPQNALVYDLVYNPPETTLLREAKKAGASTLSGLAMLVYQGAASFRIWTGREAPLDIMFSAAREGIAQYEAGGI
ncbi:MAG: shikimate dehydrogenase, partial [Chloroflexi bacterium]|nr:shikimate dehydrogenase [Chloroflexota bacterium]